MEYTLVIYCEECTKEKREKDKYYPPIDFYSLTAAIKHYEETKHTIRVELEAVTREE